MLRTEVVKDTHELMLRREIFKDTHEQSLRNKVIKRVNGLIVEILVVERKEKQKQKKTELSLWHSQKKTTQWKRILTLICFFKV